MHTYLEAKNAVAGLLNRTDGATANTIRDNAINTVRTSEIANAYPFSWLEKSATVTTSSGVADLAADFNITHTPKDVREVNAGGYNDYIYTKVDRREWDSASGLYVYYIDWNTSTSKWQIHTPSDVTLTYVYYSIPAALVADDAIDVIPELEPIMYLAAAKLFIARTDETNFDRFASLGKSALRDMILRDKRQQPLRPTRSTARRVNMGWNGY